MKRLCTICARAGSKGVKNKNLRELLGKPLIAYSVCHARDSALFSSIAVSSDSDEILEIARRWGADHLVKRPDQLATDNAAKLPAIRHCVAQVERRTGETFDVVVDLDVTSPLRSPDDIVQCVRILEEQKVSNVITGSLARRSPYFNMVELDNSGYAHLSKALDVPVVRRQDAPKCYDMNASVYAWKRDVLFSCSSIFNRDTRLYEMPEERSIDIDSELDFRFVEFLLEMKSSIAE